MKEYEYVIQNLEKLRTNYGLKPAEVDSRAKLKKGTYQGAIDGSTDLTVKDLIAIVKIYVPDPSKVFKQKMRMPAFKDLPEDIRKIASERLGKTDKVIEKKDLIHYCILIFDKHFKLNDDFTNSEIKSYLNDDLKKAFEGKSIEWEKSIIAEYVLDTETTRPGKTKPGNIYRLIKEIPADMVEKASERVGKDWLRSDEKSDDESEN